MKINDYIGEATAYDKKVALEHRESLSWRNVSSSRRNPIIADLFQRVHLMERRGSGFKKVLDAYKFESETRGKEFVPEFRSTVAAFFVVLPNLNYGIKINGVESSGEEDTVGNGAKMPYAPTEKTTEKNCAPTEKTTEKTSDLIIRIISNNPSVSMAAIAKELKLSEDGVYWQMKQLRAKGLIRRVGPDKGGHWEVVKAIPD